MLLKQTLVDELGFEKAAEACVTGGFDNCPPLIIDECLSGALTTVAAVSRSQMATGVPVYSETITMPRKGFGSRPIIIGTHPARLAYAALVSTIKDLLPPSSRVDYQGFRRYGVDSQETYLVDLDIAAYYEYIDHAILGRELVVRTMNSQVAASIVRLLEELHGRPVGIPQLSGESDALADCYIEILTRRLEREQLELRRYVDDFRILCDSWEKANDIVELFGEHARRIGLVPSSEKTSIRRREKVLKELDDEKAVFEEYFSGSRQEAWDAFFGGGPYGGEESSEPGDDVVESAAAFRLIEDWERHYRSGNLDLAGPLTPHLTRCLRLAVSHDERLNDQTLTDLVFTRPGRVQQVIGYITQRVYLEREESWGSLAALAKMGRQSPWAKLWIMYGIHIGPGDDPLSPGFFDASDWLGSQLNDRHEIVRAQAAWVSSCRSAIGLDGVLELYSKATDLSRHALAACLAKSGGMKRSVLAAVKSESPLNKAAMQWVENG